VARAYDLAVVGGGTGGLVGALIAAGLGARVVLVERERTGGDCLWTGCVPSKALLASAALAQRMRDAGGLGLPAVDPQVDLAAVMRHVQAAQAALEPQDSPERLRAAGVEVIRRRHASPGRAAWRWMDASCASGARWSRPAPARWSRASCATPTR